VRSYEIVKVGDMKGRGEEKMKERSKRAEKTKRGRYCSPPLFVQIVIAISAG